MKRKLAFIMAAIMLVTTPASVLASDSIDISVISEETVEEPEEVVEADVYKESAETSEISTDLAGISSEQTASANSGMCGEDVSWILNGKGTLTIKGKGPMDNYRANSAPWEEKKDTIQEVVIEDGITSIGSFAFFECRNLKSVRITDTITSIEERAFYGCISLADLTMPNSGIQFGTDAFGNCPALMKTVEETTAPEDEGYEEPAAEENENTSLEEETYDEEVNPLNENAQADDIEDGISPFALLPSGEDDTEFEGTNEGYLDIDSSALPDNEELIEGYIEQVFDLSDIVVIANHGEKYLSGNGLEIYEALRSAIEDIAAGNMASTSISLSGPFTWTYEELGLDSSVSASVALNEISPVLSEIISYLLVDCPYDLYWYDKTASTRFSYSYSYFEGVSVTLRSLTIIMPVASAYRAGDYDSSSPTVDTEKTSVPNDAAANAQAIVADYSSVTDSKEKMTAYKDAICNLVSYNYDAADDNYTDGYGDPWQLVYVFDGDKSTNVVCEGYSKAFQYLCDLDGGDELCYLVTGTMTGGTGSGSHMWNIVRLDGTNYLVDVTNSDEGSVGQNGGLFLVTDKDATSSDYPTYTFSPSTTSISYLYDSKTLSLYPASVLTLGTTAPKDLSDYDLVLSTEEYSYDGTAKEPAVTITHELATLVLDEDYRVSYSNNVNAGTATVTVTGIGDYTGEETAEFTINPADISSADLVLSTTGYTYDGTAKEPNVTASYNGTALKEGTDFTVSYSNNINAGAATASVTGIGNYTGTLSATFTIEAISISNMTLSVSPESYIYDEMEKQPDVTVTTGSETLTGGTDYTVSYENNTNAGTATVTVTGSGNYTGILTAAFIINAADISNATLTLSSDSFEYSGSAIKPDVIVTNGSTTLTSGTDYTVSYRDNIKIGTEATVTVTGEGNYTGTLSTIFEITVADILKTSVKLSQQNYTYDGSEKKPDVTVTNGNVTLTSGTDYIVSYSKNTNAGTATVTIAGKGNYTGELSVTFTINPASLSDATVSLSQNSYTYNGSAKKPTVTVKNGGKTLTSGTDYSVSYSNNTNAGTAKAIVTGKGNYTGTASKNFTINKASQTLTAKASSSSIVKGTTATIKASGKGTITYSSSNKSIATVSSKGVITAKAPGKATITVKAAGNSNYKSASKTLTIKVNPKATSLKSAKSSSSKKLTVKWKKVSGVTGYQIQYSTNKNFKSGNKTVNVSGASKVSKTISKLKKGKTYYVRVRTYKTVSGTKYYSSWTSKKKVKVK